MIAVAEEHVRAQTIARTIDALRRAREDTIGVATFAVDGGHGLPRVAFTWEQGEAERFVGSGETARVEASGEDRFASIRSAAEALFARVIEVRSSAAQEAPTTRLFGGAAFGTGGAAESPWSSFADASFVLPRVRLATASGHSFMSIALTRAEALAGGFDAELARVARARDVRLIEGTRRGPAPSGARIEFDREAFVSAVRRALEAIDEARIEKVVPMELCRVEADHELSPSRAFARLRVAYPSCTRFSIERGGATFLGASPETLVEREGATVRADALAGTTRRRLDGEGDERARAALLASDKDLREHRAVALAIAATLRQVSHEVSMPAAPGLRSLANVHHLHSRIEAELRAPTHVLELVARLHPTPAVAGAPRAAALAWLAEHEPAPRGWYAGPVGWFDASGNGAFVVAIRSGLVHRARAFLYAGAGVVRGSLPDAEHDEVVAKYAPMLDALEVRP